MALADSVHALALEVYAKRPAGVAPTAWLTDSTGVPAVHVRREVAHQVGVVVAERPHLVGGPVTRNL